MKLSLTRRAELIKDLSFAYESLSDCGAPTELVAGVGYWLRRVTREGLTDADLEHVLQAIEAATLAPRSTKPPDPTPIR